MTDALFWIFSLAAVVSGVMVVACRNTINCAMALVCSMFFIAGLFVLLGAYFLAAVQILVYAGAVMVLFLFVIMLLDVATELKRRLRHFQIALSILVALAFGAVLFHVQKKAPLLSFAKTSPPGTVEAVGKSLFTEYLVPFEVTSLLLLVAIIGVILLTRHGDSSRPPEPKEKK